ncbi:autotransporter domain-containing protein [Amorphus orientalis]|uniref:Outer membrane autotransporter protein n=1 Tax=Amorphus orientalis TaxID=649198 RepID=A0AAE4ATT4_9HYPH|nr:autotransporter domain-containing protein [Amorphus orientalis]MDQ0316452.1 outer membrane autotransporter protein [Amorphus orientalis]
MQTRRRLGRRPRNLRIRLLGATALLPALLAAPALADETIGSGNQQELDGSFGNSGGTLTVDGTLIIKNGGQQTDTAAILGVAPRADGFIRVTGSGSKLINTGASPFGLEVGKTSGGTLRVEDGGSVTTATGMAIGSGSGSTGLVIVEGSGSTLQVTGAGQVGKGGLGTLNIRNAGTVSISDTLSLGGDSTGSGSVLVSGSGSILSADSVQVGIGGTGTLVLTEGGTVSVRSGNGTLQLGSSAKGTLAFGAARGSSAAAPGTLSAGSIAFGGPGEIVLNHTDTGYTLGLAISGSGTAGMISQLAGTTILSGNSGAFAGSTTVSGGSLIVNGTLGASGSTLSVESGGLIGGSGTVGGSATIAGRLSPGPAGGGPATLSFGNALTLTSSATSQFELHEAEIGGGASNDFVPVSGSLTLGGALQAQVDAVGHYDLFTYGSRLTGTFGSVSVTGTRFDTAEVQTDNPGEVNLVVRGFSQKLQFWDGTDMVGDGTVKGGPGVWNATNTNWTDLPGRADSNDTWGSTVGIFAGQEAGTVTVEGTQRFDTLQFKRSGYTLTGGALALAPTRGTQGTFNVDTGVTATIASTIADGTVTGLRKAGGGTLRVTGTTAHTGDTLVDSGTLLVEGTVGAAGSTVSVASDATLSGTGRIGGSVSLDGVLSPGTRPLTSPGTLTIGQNLVLNPAGRVRYELGAAGLVGGGDDDLVVVGGNLSLGGTLQAHAEAAGYYRLFDYGGALSGSFANTQVVGLDGASTEVQTEIAGQVNLFIRGAGQTFQFWDGTTTTGNGTVEGGPGTWDATTTNWTGAPGRATINAPWAGSVGVFAGASAGAVTVAGTQSFDTLQFARDGYTLSGGVLAFSPARGQAATINVDSGVSTTIASQLADGTATGLIKAGGGTLTLTGANTYSGSTTVAGGTLIGSAASIRGDLMNAGAVIFDQTADGTFAGAVSAYDGLAGSVTKRGAGALTLTGMNGLNWTVEAGRLITGTGLLGGDVSVASGAGLVFDQTGQGTYASTISGAGTLAFRGGGTGILTGDSSGFAGATTVSDYTLLVNGRLGGGLTVGGSGRLGGSGTVGTTSLASGGTIAPGNSIGTLNVAGDLTFTAGSAYEVETEPGGTSADLIAVTGTATLAGNVLHVGEAGEYAFRERYTILTAGGGVVGTFAGVSSNYAFLDPTLSYAPTSVMLTLERNDVDFSDVTITANQRATAIGVESLGPGNPLYDDLLGLTPSEALQAFDALSGEVYATVETGLIEDSRFVRDTAMARVRQAFGALSAQKAVCPEVSGAIVPLTDRERQAMAERCTPRPLDYAAWAEAFGAWGDSDGNGNAATLDRSTAGVFAGGDAALGAWSRAGFLVGYQTSSYDVDARASSADADTYHLGLYGGTRWRGVNLRAGGAYAWHDLDADRAITFPGFSESTTASYQARTAQAFGEIGYDIRTGPVGFEPFAGLAHVRLETDGFRESGGGAAALSVADDETDVTYTTLGVRAEADTFLGRFPLAVSGALGWRHAFGSVDPTSTHAFAGGSWFAVEGVPVATDVAVVEAGVGVRLAPQAVLSASYEGQLGDRVQDHSARGRFLLEF